MSILNSILSITFVVPFSIKVATENNCTNVTALLLDYKNQNFADFDPMEEFSLEL